MTDAATTPRSASEAAIRDLVDQANRHQSDADRFLALHTGDVTIVNVMGRRVQGMSELEPIMRQAMESRLANVITHVEVEHLTFLRDDVALVSASKKIDNQNDDGSDQSLPGAAVITYVVVATDAGWKIALAQTTPLGQAPPEPVGG